MKKWLIASGLLGLVVSTSVMAGGPDAMSQAAPAPYAVPAAAAVGQMYVGIIGGVQFIGGDSKPQPGYAYSENFNTGWNIGAHVGYDFGTGLAAELAFDYMRHSDKRTGVLASSGLGRITPWTLMANALYHFDMGGAVRPYVGVGLGILNFVATGAFSGWAEDVHFSYQAIAGVEYKLDSTVGVTLGYHFVDVTGKEWGYSLPHFHQINLGLNYYF